MWLDANDVVVTWVVDNASDVGVHMRPSGDVLFAFCSGAFLLGLCEDPATEPKVTLGRPGVEIDMIYPCRELSRSQVVIVYFISNDSVLTSLLL